ncbi:MAG: class I SAM-dependent methyltransferase [Bacteroidota bacterium]
MESLQECPICQSKSFDTQIETATQMHAGSSRFNFDRCQDCELVFLNPRVSSKRLKDYYTDYYLPYRGPSAWGKYAKQVDKSQKQLDALRTKSIGQYHPIKSSSILLDIGCGQPSFLVQAKAKYQCRAIGIDFTDEGWKTEPSAFAGLELHTGEIKDLPQALQADVITMWHYLEHDYTPLTNLQSLHQHAHEKTTLIIEVPNYDSESRRKFGEYWAGYHSPRHTSLFNPKSMTTLLENSGWKVKEILTYGTLNPYILYWMSKMEKKGIRWDKNMEEEFVGFVLGWIAFYPKALLQKKQSLGIMTAIAEPA